MSRSERAAIAAAFLAVAASAAAAEQRPSVPPPADTVALIGDSRLTKAELEEIGGGRLFAMRTQEYSLTRQLLDEAISKRLLDKEAAARGISADELLRVEVNEKAVPVTEAEQKSLYEANKARFGATPEADALKQIENGLRQQRVRERRNEYVATLRAKAAVRVLLEPPRASVGPGHAPPRGSAAAPVTIVEFSDFQCPYCSQVTATLQKLQDRYGDKIRLAFRDFPLQQIHKDAPKAAEAAACASDQGKFWEMHDRLFSDQHALQVEGLKKSAAELGLDPATFDECLDSGRHAKDWQADQAEGARYGVTATPAFFVNGRLLLGAQPLDGFVSVIDEELQRAEAANTLERKPSAKKKGGAP
jgi:protein-disulfide isomerase